MNKFDVRTKAVQFLHNESEKVITRPHQLVFTAKHVSSAFGGYAGLLGKVADNVVQDLLAMGVHCRYIRNSNPRKFILDL